MDAAQIKRPVTRHILIVDDEPVNRKAAEAVLQQQGFAVTGAQNGTDAKALLQANKYDLVILDIVMPDIDGYQIIKIMRANPNLKTIPIVVVSGLKDKQTVANCIKLGANDFIVKPYDPNYLVERVGKVFAQPKNGEAPIASAEAPAPASTRKDALKILVTKLENDELEFPAMPEVGFKIVHMLQDDSVSINKVAELIEKEPGIAAKVIKAGNSSLFAGAKPAMNPRDAVVRIGVKQAMNYVLLVTNSKLYKDESAGSKELRKKMWSHALATAVAARITGSMLGYPSVDNLFAFGLLHDIGKILLMRLFSELPTEAKENDPKQLEQTLEKLHTQFGGQLLDKWKFPKEFVGIAKLHHEKPIKGKLSDAVIIVGFANLFAHELEGEFNDEKIEVFSRIPHSQVLKMKPQTIKKMAEQIVHEIGVLEKLFA